MHPISTSLSTIYQSPIAVMERDEPYFKSAYHFHPEFELVYIIEGFGKRIIGNTVQDFQKGELLLLGGGIPHLWMSDPAFYSPQSKLRSKSLVLNFHPGIFSESFYAMKENAPLKKLFAEAQYGLIIDGVARQAAVSRLQQLSAAISLDKVIHLLEILQILSLSEDCRIIDHSAGTRQYADGRLSKLFRFVEVNLEKNITLQRAAELTNFTPPSFSRFFKQKTGKNFIDYLQQTRVSWASKQLIETDWSVAEIAHRTGYKTVTHFNRSFKKVTGESPTHFRKSLIQKSIA